MLWFWVFVMPVVLLLALGYWVDRKRGGGGRVDGITPHGGEPESKFFNRYDSSS
jgi:hypothetical protein